MRFGSGLRLAVAALPLVLLGVDQAAAVELRAGGYGAVQQDVAPDDTLRMDTEYLEDGAETGITLDFTPRASGMLFTRHDEPANLQLSLGVHDQWGSDLRLDTVGLSGGLSSRGAGAGVDSKALAVGGALVVEDWKISGGFGRAPLMGVDSDVMSAGVSYGPMSARLVYGQILTEDDQRDVVMFSTDLAAWSWLTLQSDVAISETEEQESMAVGRLGVRLQF